MADLDALYAWFDENREHIIQNRRGERVLLKDYPDMDTALSAAEEKAFVLGDFLIQDCVTGEEEAILFYPFFLY